MIFANVDGNREEAEPEKKGVCPFCNQNMIAKCGEINTWHWAHKTADECDPWKSAESEWHRVSKQMFPNACVEQTIEVNGKRHIADVAIKRQDGTSFVIEFQNSPISPQQIREREEFYGSMAWVFNTQEKYKKNLFIQPWEDISTFVWKHFKKVLWDVGHPLFLDINNQCYFKILEIYEDISPVCGYGIVVDKKELINFALMKNDWMGMLTPRQKDDRVYASVARFKGNLGEFDSKFAHKMIKTIENYNMLSHNQRRVLLTAVLKR